MSAETRQTQWHPAALVHEVAAGQPKAVEVGGIRIALCKVEGDPNVYAIEDVCTHDDGPLAEGTLSDSEIECPRHGAKFNIKTGAVLSMPATVPIRAFKTRIAGDQIEVELPQ